MSKARILIVEDEAIVAEDLSQKLERLGYEVVGVAATGPDSLSLARNGQPDLVLMDIRLQGKMDGVEAAQAIRRECDVPIVFLTAHSDPETLQRAKGSDPFGYILKPFETPQLETQIQIALHKHQAEREIQRQREWLRVTLRSIGDAVITTDAEGMVTSLNPAAEGLTGWTMDEALGRPLVEVFSIINEETRKPASDPVERVLKEGNVVGLANHTALISRDGKETTIEDSAAPIKDAQGRIIGVVMVFHDVTEKRRAEQRLRDSEERERREREFLECVISNAGSCMAVVKGHELRYTMANAAFQAFAGDVSMVGRTYREVFPEAAAAGAETLIQRVLETGEPWKLENYRAPVPGKPDATWQGQVVRLPVAAGEEPSVLAAVWDITERVRAEQALRQLNDQLEQRVAQRTAELAHAGERVRAERQRFLDMLDTLPVIVDIIRADHRIEWTNRAYREALGNNEGRLCYQSQFGYDKSCVECQAFMPLTTGKPHHWEWTLPNGQTFDIYNFPFAASDGSPAILEMDIDITEIRKAQATLKETNESLEQRVAERTEALVEADRRKDEFLAMLAHELRNPLAPVRNAVEIMNLIGPKDPVLVKNRELIDRQISHMSRLLDDLLDVSRITRGRIALQLERLDLRTVLMQAVEVAHHSVNRDQLQIEYANPTAPIWILGDYTRLEQIVGNVLNNAIKYTEEGEIRISLTAEPDQKGDPGWAAVRVRDTGIGIPAGMLPQVFDLFVQVDQSLDRRRGGLGIGLTMVDRLVTLHGGNIEAHSDGIGRGSEFVIRLPLAEDPGALNTADSHAVAQTDVHRRNGLRKVLVVDDNADAALSLATILELWGYEVVTAHDGPAALDMVMTATPHVVLLDIGLPQMDGYEVARRVRSEEKLNHVRIIAITGYGQDEARLHSTECGIEAHLVKPVDLGKLQTILTDGFQIAT